jgi:3-oxoacyl-[acyl-carrier protein] reductase
MDLGIKGRKAIVCASSKGLGRACAFSLAREGCEVFINGRDVAALEATAGEIRAAAGAEVVVVAGDVGSAEGRRALLAACPAPDILVNNNGGPPPKPFKAIERQDILAGIEANMLTPIALIQAVLDGMVQRRFGRIVNITSVSVKMPLAGLDLSSGARAGLTAFVAGIARSVADKNVTINNLLPGSFDTARLSSGFRAAAKRSGLSEAEIAERSRKAIPARRFGTPAEFGHTCAFLCSEHASYLTGQNILLDGGDYPGAF